MSRKITVVISFLLLCQFCASAQNWLAVGGGVMPPVISIQSFYLDSVNNRLLACAHMGATTRSLQYTASNNWDSLGSLSPAVPTQFVNYRGTVYGASGYGVYEFIGSAWQPFVLSHGGVTGFYLNDTDLYVYGMFDSIAGIAANKIARYDGSTWHSINNANFGGSAIVYSTFYQGDLYIGGGFYSVPANTYKLSKCDWTQWQNLGNYFTGGFDFVTCLAVYNGELYVGGYFSNGCPGSYIARWNGNTWTQVGGGMDGEVFCMKVFNGELWVGGSFYTAGGVVCPSLAKYNGTDWCNVGNFDNTVTAIEEYNGELYVGGGFWTVDGDSVPPVVKWIGGNNTNACGHLNTGIEESTQSFSVSAFPNPASENILFQFPNPISVGEIVVTDNVGREVKRQELNGEKQVDLSASDLADGMYFYQVVGKDNTVFSGKFIVQH